MVYLNSGAGSNRFRYKHKLKSPKVVSNEWCATLYKSMHNNYKKQIVLIFHCGLSVVLSNCKQLTARAEIYV